MYDDLREQDFLQHYSSQYYDPAKAHEYYLKNRELKERQTPLSDTQREAKNYASKTIGEARKADTTKASEAQAARMEKLRKDAAATADRISQKLEALFAKLKTEAVEVKLNPIPANATPKLRAFLEKQNKSIQDRANKAAASKGKAAKDAARTQLQKTSADLRGALSSARDSYKKQKEEISAKYDKALETEDQNIRSQVK